MSATPDGLDEPGRIGDEAPPEDPRAVAAADLRGGLLWLVFGVAVLVGSLTMDRLEHQNINPVTVPGLLPGLLGLALIALGSVLAIRSWRRGGRGGSPPPLDAALFRRLAWVNGLILVFTFGLVGHGLPFWLASALYVATSILVLQTPQRRLEGRSLGVREFAFAVAVGLGSGAVISYVFQELFLVRLP